MVRGNFNKSINGFPEFRVFVSLFYGFYQIFPFFGISQSFHDYNEIKRIFKPFG